MRTEVLRSSNWRGVVIAPGAAMLLAAALAVLAPSPAGAQVISRVIASVDGDPITTHDIQAFAAANNITLPPPGDPNQPKATKAVLKGIIENKMLDQESKKYADKVDDGQVNQYIQSMEQENHVNEQQFRDQLTQNGLTYEEFRGHVRDQLMRMAMLQDEVRSKVTIPQSEVEAYYKAHPGEFQITKERLKLAQILIAVPPNATPKQIAEAKAKAEMVDAKAIKGDDFAALASQYSDDDSKSKGGELGYFAPNEILPQIDKAVENLKPGQISPVVHSDFGFHILKLEAHEKPGLQPLDQATVDKIRNQLATEAAKKRFKSWVENDLVKQHDVELSN
ncbi:MAG TPA: peptidylprolyl isomerase [Candidatus Binataceae bacterium]|nr:peptidylprolyl isomerase [Candidatus Binataceae bacterium]